MFAQSHTKFYHLLFMRFLRCRSRGKQAQALRVRLERREAARRADDCAIAEGVCLCSVQPGRAHDEDDKRVRGYSGWAAVPMAYTEEMRSERREGGHGSADT